MHSSSLHSASLNRCNNSNTSCVLLHRPGITPHSTSPVEKSSPIYLYVYYHLSYFEITYVRYKDKKRKGNKKNKRVKGGKKKKKKTPVRIMIGSFSFVSTERLRRFRSRTGALSNRYFVCTERVFRGSRNVEVRREKVEEIRKNACYSGKKTRRLGLQLWRAEFRVAVPVP